jgi:hypothetical protein
MSVKVLLKGMGEFTWPELRVSTDVLEARDLMIDLLKPASMAAFVMALWRFGSDLGWTSDFLFSEGLISHWQFWAVLGVSMILGESYASSRLTRE